MSEPKTKIPASEDTTKLEHWLKFEEETSMPRYTAGNSYVNASDGTHTRRSKERKRRRDQSLRETTPDARMRRQSNKPTIKSFKRWTKLEDNILLTLYTAGDSWQKISDQIPGRNLNACECRWDKKLKKRYPEARMRRASNMPTGKHLRFSKSEDDLLLPLLPLRATGMTWKTISGHLPGRDGDSCRQRAAILESK